MKPKQLRATPTNVFALVKGATQGIAFLLMVKKIEPC
jgi:hypothetical protein